MFTRIDEEMRETKSQVVRLIDALSKTERGKLPSQTLSNPNNHSLKVISTEKFEEVKSITILRSGKEIGNDAPKANEKSKETPAKKNERLMHFQDKASCEGDHILDRTDLRASVNLLPFSVYLQLRLGKLKPTFVTLQLAYCSVRKPRNERMKITFGSMTTELNIFNVNQQQLVDEDFEYMNLIEILEEEQVMVAKKIPRSKKKSLHAYSDVPKLELEQPPTGLTHVSIQQRDTFTVDVPLKLSVGREFYWTTNLVDWMTCTWLIQSPGLVVQSTGCRAWEFLPDSVAWTTNSGNWISADKMKFLLTALKIFYVLEPNLQPIPDPTPEDTEQLKQQRIKREEDELVCRGHILNTLSDRLYDLFTTMTSPKEIWKALETKYKTEKQGTDKFIIQKFLKNQMKEKELNTSEANVVDEIVAMVSEMQIGMIIEVHMANAAENSSEWWYDSSATIHEAVELILSSGKKLKLTNVYHVPDIKKNLVSASLLSKNGVKAVLESDKLILSKFAYFRVPDPKRTKLGPRAIKSVFVGYAVNSKAYRLLDLSSNTIVESRDVEFIENKFINDSQIEPKQTQESDSLVNDSLSGNKRIEPSSPSEQRRSQRVRKEKDFGPDFISYQVNVYLVEGNREKVLSKLPFVGNVEEDPNTYSEAMASRDAAFWREKLLMMKWTQYCPTILGFLWIFLRVLIPLVVNGYLEENIGLMELFKPLKQALASIYKLVVHQMDVKTAFLNGDLDEEVYMDQPEGFVLPGNEKKVSNGFKHNGADKCVYSKFTSEYGVIVCLYVDDMLIFGTNMLGIKVKRHSEGYALCQSHYIEKVFLKYKHLNVKEVNTPFDSNYKLVENTGRAIAQLEFASAIGSMMYVMHCTRPDIAFAVNRLSRYPAVLEGYSDANWVTSVGDNKSTSGWIFTLGGEAEWLRNMLYDIELWPQPMSAISIYCDSQATLSKAYSKIYNGKSRHISLRHEYVRQLIEDGVISIVYVKSSGNLADPFTKGLSRDMGHKEGGTSPFCEHRSDAASKQELRSSRLDLTDFASLEFLPNPVYWTTNPVDWMTCTWLIQSPGLVVQSTGCRAWEFLPDSVAWTTNSGDWISAVKAVNDR
uniref:Uncharacterized protein n=1 Tax=Fagus sylvatica TaxID=28930 RepID=A0A2N9HGJ4_FAGSY